MVSLRHVVGPMAVLGVLFLFSGEARAQTSFFTGGPAITKEQQASVFAYVKNAWQVSDGKTATDVEVHRQWARGQTEAVLKGEIDRLVNVTLGNIRKIGKARLVEVFANLKQGAAIAANKEAGHTLAGHTGWANGQTEETLRGEVARIALAGAKAI
ncbi:hypothetical protein [Archangium lipolyticum]|uniref:hypothetical protein n=1 Tax=Archangium lipolyticum TaxID=2970465 RepID=UPI002149CBD2|nr:hypothetical protein [Archangium lipolyticum]